MVTSPSLSVKCRMFWVESASVHEILFFCKLYIVYLVDHLQLSEHEATKTPMVNHLLPIWFFWTPPYDQHQEPWDLRMFIPLLVCYKCRFRRPQVTIPCQPVVGCLKIMSKPYNPNLWCWKLYRITRPHQAPCLGRRASTGSISEPGQWAAERRRAAAAFAETACRGLRAERRDGAPRLWVEEIPSW